MIGRARAWMLQEGNPPLGIRRLRIGALTGFVAGVSVLRLPSESTLVTWAVGGLLVVLLLNHVVHEACYLLWIVEGKPDTW